MYNKFLFKQQLHSYNFKSTCFSSTFFTSAATEAEQRPHYWPFESYITAVRLYRKLLFWRSLFVSSRMKHEDYCPNREPLCIRGSVILMACKCQGTAPTTHRTSAYGAQKHFVCVCVFVHMLFLMLACKHCTRQEKERVLGLGCGVPGSYRR